MQTQPSGSKTGYAQFPKSKDTGVPLPGTKHWEGNVAPNNNFSFMNLFDGSGWKVPTVVSGKLVYDGPMAGMQNAGKYWYHTIVWLLAVGMCLGYGIQTYVSDEPGSGFLQPKKFECMSAAVTANCAGIGAQPACGDGTDAVVGTVCGVLATQYTAASMDKTYTETPSEATKAIALLTSICFAAGFLFFYLASACFELTAFTRQGWLQVVTLSLLGFGMCGSFFLLIKASAVTENDEPTGFVGYLMNTLVMSLALITYYTFSADLGFALLRKGLVPGMAFGVQVIVHWMINAGEGVATAAAGVKDSSGVNYAARFKEVTTAIMVLDAVALGTVVVGRMLLNQFAAEDPKGKGAEVREAIINMAALHSWPVLRSWITLLFGISAVLSLWQFDCMALTDWFVGTTAVYPGSTAQILRFYSTASMLIHLTFFFMLLEPKTVDAEQKADAIAAAEVAGKSSAIVVFGAP